MYNFAHHLDDAHIHIVKDNNWFVISIGVSCLTFGSTLQNYAPAQSHWAFLVINSLFIAR